LGNVRARVPVARTSFPYGSSMPDAIGFVFPAGFFGSCCGTAPPLVQIGDCQQNAGNVIAAGAMFCRRSHPLPLRVPSMIEVRQRDLDALLRRLPGGTS